MKIENIKVNKILDSRGEWTIEVEILSEGIKEKASVPSGKSKGSYEAVSLSFEEIQKNLKNFLEEVKNIDFKNSKDFDKFLIERAGKNKEKLGANFTLGASIAFSRVLAKKEGLDLWEYLRRELDTNDTNKFAKIRGLIINLIGGGVHSNNNLDFQEYWLITDSVEDFENVLEKVLNIINKLEKKLSKPLGRNDEGAFCTNFLDNYEPFIYLRKVIHELNTNRTNDTRMTDELDTNDTNESRMENEFNTNDTNSDKESIIFKELSYKIVGILYKIHNQLGPNFEEEHYKQAIKSLLEKENITFTMERPPKLETSDFSVEGVKADFIIEDKILLEVKAKPNITKEDLKQINRYLIASKLPLGIIVNFRSKKLTFKRILNPSALKKFANNNTNNIRMETNDTIIIRDAFDKIRDRFVNITLHLGADIAANQINKNLNWEEVYEKLKNLEVKYLEDPFKEDEFEKFAKLRKQGFKVIGDDLTVTNIERLKIALEKNSVDGVVVKPNQVGTILETFEFVKLAKENGLFTVFSHRSGETNDNWIIDLGIAFFADLFKIGPPVQGERIAKYNRLREILSEFKL